MLRIVVEFLKEPVMLSGPDSYRVEAWFDKLTMTDSNNNLVQDQF
jgi:hypothetical protein